MNAATTPGLIRMSSPHSIFGDSVSRSAMMMPFARCAGQISRLCKPTIAATTTARMAMNAWQTLKNHGCRSNDRAATARASFRDSSTMVMR